MPSPGPLLEAVFNRRARTAALTNPGPGGRPPRRAALEPCPTVRRLILADGHHADSPCRDKRQLPTFFPMAVGNKGLPEFHPQSVIRDWGDGHAFRVADAQTGVCVFGATGSGKTSGPAKHLAYGYLAANFGGLVLCAKKEERHQWEQWAADTGRTDDLVIVNSQGDWRFNFLEWEASRPEEGGGLTINIVAILDEIASAVASSAGKADDGQGDNKFWSDALHHLNTNLVELPIFAGLRVSLPLMRSILNAAPQSQAQTTNPEWRAKSMCWKVLQEADEATVMTVENGAVLIEKITW